MSTKITCNHNGSIRIEGDDFEILDPTGAPFGLAGRTAIGLSSKASSFRLGMGQNLRRPSA